MAKKSKKPTPALSHLSESGDARMVDVGDKAVTARRAVACAEVLLGPQAARIMKRGDLKKGDALAVARLAGIQAAKKTSDLIPLCHPLSLTHVRVDLKYVPSRRVVRIEAEIRCEGKTGVEMEAMTAVSVAALSLYDMLKGADKGITIGPIRLMEKSGGRSGDWRRER